MNETRRKPTTGRQSPSLCDKWHGIHPPRRAPIRLRDQIKAELGRMTALDVIRPINEPTDWVSSITYVTKPDGTLRICLDPKDINSSLTRGQHHIPTLEELTHRFAKASLFKAGRKIRVLVHTT